MPAMRRVICVVPLLALGILALTPWLVPRASLGELGKTRFAWHDCGNGDATMHFDSMSSDWPVKYGTHQVINTTLHFDVSYSRITADVKLYYRLFGQWVWYFHEWGGDVCAQHPEVCGVAPGVEIHVTTKHPKPSVLAPVGTYRANYKYYEPTNGTYIGCVDWEVPYTY
mmetsp:Transcript_33821/g.107368  ORF Transcript_33821/g.107368 Transcript_33821/m.107368 type:complete len:169 (-) Transcript_33821:38-544(-)